MGVRGGSLSLAMPRRERGRQGTPRWEPPRRAPLHGPTEAERHPVGDHRHYGTLIDWEGNPWTHSRRRPSATASRSTSSSSSTASSGIPSPEIMGGSYELYAEVLRRTAVKVAGEIGWELDPPRLDSCPTASPAGFRSVRQTLPWTGSASALRARDHLEHRRQAAGRLAPPPAHRSRSGRHRAAGAQLQARPRPLQGGARRIGGKKGWVHIASGYDADVAPLLNERVPVIWVNRRGEKLDEAQKPTRR